MIENFPQFKNRARLLHEIAFSVYCPLLLIMVNAVRSAQHLVRNSWVDDLQLLITRSRHTPSYHFAFDCLWALSALALFLCLRMLARVSFSDVFLRTFAGVVAVAGFPLAAGYVSFRGYLHMLSSFPNAFLNAYAPHRWLALEVIASLACIFLYLFRKWPTKPWWGLLLLSLHFAVWSWVVLLGTGSGSMLHNLTYPLLGFLASLAWAWYVQQRDLSVSARSVTS